VATSSVAPTSFSCGWSAGTIQRDTRSMRTPYDLTAELTAAPAGSDVLSSRRTKLVLAAFAVTLCRWTAVSEVAIAVTDRSSERARVVRFQVDDHVAIEDFPWTIQSADDADHMDLEIASDHGDLRSGEVRFVTDVPDVAHGFVADVAAAVAELVSLKGSVEDVRCIAPERRKVLDTLAGADVPAVDIETLFLDQVRRRPQQVAVRDAGVELTYEQLAHAADQHAGTLRRAGVGPGDTVLVATRRSLGEIVALVAISRLGAAYAGFENDAPQARAERIIGRLAPTAAVVDATTADHRALRGLTRVDAWHPGQHVHPDPTPLVPPRSNDPHRAAYVAFTSGSTGEPKGVVVPHQAVTRLVLTAELRMYPGDRVLRMAPLAFDASTFEIWVALLSGATLEVFPAKLPSVGKLDAFFVEREISVAWLTASLFRLVAKSRPKAFAGLRWLVTGGEVVPHESAARMLESHPGLVITNGYGPTENTTFTATHTVRDSAEIDGPLPIGRPVAGTRVYVLDRNARLVPPGAVGELYAAGLGVADGYLGDEAGTSSRFGYFSPDVGERLYRTGDLVRLDPDGRLLFLGRVDRQVKLDGHRIETEEISATLARHPAVRDAVIIVARPANRGIQLVAAVAVRSGADADPRSLRAYLAELLPSYAIPALWVLVDEIPLTHNGKADAQILIESALPA
jgi:amino acid adenylation domain-containing protein